MGRVIEDQAKLLAEQMDRIELLQKNIKMTATQKAESAKLMDEIETVKEQVLGLKSQGFVNMWSTNNKMHVASGSYPGWQRANALNPVDGTPNGAEAAAHSSQVEAA